MKKVTALLFAVFLCLMLSVSTFAAQTCKISSEPAMVKCGENVTVPIKISTNTGIMGFRLSVEYPNEQFELTNVSTGSITSKGVFNTTVKDYKSVKGKFDILWSDTENRSGDGTVAMITFKARIGAENGIYKINISYSQEDTFDENWNDVEFVCSSISVEIFDSVTETSTTKAVTVQDNAGNDIETPISDDYLISSVESVLESYNQVSPDKIVENDEKNAILNYVNNRLNSFSDSAEQYTSYDDLQESYYTATVNQTVKEIMDSTDGDTIIKILNEALNKYGVKTFEELPEGDREKAFNEICQAFSDVQADMITINKVPDKYIMKMLDDLRNKVAEQDMESIPVQGKNAIKLKPIIIVSVISIFVFIAIIITIKFRKKKGKEVKENEK